MERGASPTAVSNRSYDGSELERTWGQVLRGSRVRFLRLRGEENSRTREFVQAPPWTSGCPCASESGSAPCGARDGFATIHTLRSRDRPHPPSCTFFAGVPPASRTSFPPATRPSAWVRSCTGRPAAPLFQGPLLRFPGSGVPADSDVGETRAQEPQRVILDNTSARSAAMVRGTGRSRAPVPSARPRTGFRVWPTRMSSMLP